MLVCCESLKMRVCVQKIAVLQKQFTQTFVKTLQIKAKSLSVIALDLSRSDSLCGFLGE